MDFSKYKIYNAIEGPDSQERSVRRPGNTIFFKQSCFFFRSSEKVCLYWTSNSVVSREPITGLSCTVVRYIFYALISMIMKRSIDIILWVVKTGSFHLWNYCSFIWMMSGGTLIWSFHSMETAIKDVYKINFLFKFNYVGAASASLKMF